MCALDRLGVVALHDSDHVVEPAWFGVGQSADADQVGPPSKVNYGADVFDRRAQDHAGHAASGNETVGPEQIIRSAFAKASERVP